MLFVWCERFAPLVINNQRHQRLQTPEPVKTDLFEKRSCFPVSRPSSIGRSRLMKNKTEENKHIPMAWETRREVGTPPPATNPHCHVEAKNADEFCRSGATLGSSKHKETDMPLMPTSAGPNDPQDVRPRKGENKRVRTVLWRRQAKQKEKQKMETERRGVKAPTWITHHPAAPSEQPVEVDVQYAS